MKSYLFNQIRCKIFVLAAFVLLGVSFASSHAIVASIGDVPDVEHYEQVVEGHADEAHKEDGAEHAEDHSSGGLPQLNSSTWASQAFWLIAIFAFMYIYFAKSALPNISGTIENRKNHIASDLEVAEKLTAEADIVHDTYNKKLQQSQDLAADEIKNADQEMKAKVVAAIEAFRARSDKELQAAEERINASKAAAMGDMNVIAAEAASVAVEKIIGKTDKSKVRTIVESMSGKAKAA